MHALNFYKLPDTHLTPCQFWSPTTAEAKIRAKPSSTIGLETKNNPVLNLSREDFIRQMQQSFPDRPKSFSHIINTNKNGPSLLERCPVVRDLSPQQVKVQMERGAVILDTRDTAAFGGVHMPGSINIYRLG